MGSPLVSKMVMPEPEPEPEPLTILSLPVEILQIIARPEGSLSLAIFTSPEYHDIPVQLERIKKKGTALSALPPPARASAVALARTCRKLYSVVKSVISGYNGHMYIGNVRFFMPNYPFQQFYDQTTSLHCLGLTEPGRLPHNFPLGSFTNLKYLEFVFVKEREMVEQWNEDMSVDQVRAEFGKVAAIYAKQQWRSLLAVYGQYIRSESTFPQRVCVGVFAGAVIEYKILSHGHEASNDDCVALGFVIRHDWNIHQFRQRPEIVSYGVWTGHGSFLFWQKDMKEKGVQKIELVGSGGKVGFERIPKAFRWVMPPRVRTRWLKAKEEKST